MVSRLAGSVTSRTATRHAPRGRSGSDSLNSVPAIIGKHPATTITSALTPPRHAAWGGDYLHRRWKVARIRKLIGDSSPTQDRSRLRATIPHHVRSPQAPSSHAAASRDRDGLVKGPLDRGRSPGFRQSQ
jgi:hypothetical protein